ncbi:MAG TPA: hypothetical protein DHW02_08890, partial [Ktedonobacter sp.]|nr:hypothetical protein [Ktedonobacter sp.]
FVASQFHPEFKSRPTRPHPLFRDFVGTSVQLAQERQEQLAQEEQRELETSRVLSDARVEM